MSCQLLIVEDEVIVRNSIQKTLEKNRQSITVYGASDVYEAQEIFLNHAIQLLILDIQLPEIDGLTYLKDLRQQYPDLMVLVLSAHADFSYAQQAIDLHVQKYLVKPISKDLLLETIDACLAKLPIQQKIEHSSITDALAYIDLHFKEPLTLQELADVVHLNTSYFSTLFKQTVGINFSQYVTEKRMDAAKNLLLAHQHSIEEISIQVGYQTSKYFIQIFKDYEKITPKQYQKNRGSK